MLWYHSEGEDRMMGPHVEKGVSYLPCSSALPCAGVPCACGSERLRGSVYGNQRAYTQVLRISVCSYCVNLIELRRNFLENKGKVLKDSML